MRKNPMGGIDREIREAVLRSTRGREIQLSGPVNEASGSVVGSITPGGLLVNFGLFDVTLFDEFYLS